MDLQSDLGSLLSKDRVLTRPIDRIAYASDASFYRLIPQAIVQPVSIDEVRLLFEYSHTNRIPLTFRAAGTSLSGQAITDGILVDLSKHWGGLHIEECGERVRLQPGVIGTHANLALRPYHRRIGPDPASIDACMLGGILANNASGMCCGVSENAYHTLSSLTVLLPNGLTLDTAAPEADERLRREAPDIAQGLLDLQRRLEGDAALRQRVRAKYQMKNTTGYSLNALVDYSRPVDILAHLLIGSEGTLGFIAEAVLNTLPDYPLKYTGLLYFPAVQEAANAIVPLTGSGARALEIMDRAALRSVEALAGAPPELRDLPEAAAGLLVEYQCSTSVELAGFKLAANQTCHGMKLLLPPVFTESLAEQAALWKLRKGMFPSVGAVRKQGTTVIIEDVAFPIPRMAQAITDLQELFLRHGYEDAIIFGHAKDGNLHFVITQSFNDAREIQRYEHFMADIVWLVVEQYDGALKAEHGTGRNMAPFVETEWGGSAYDIMLELKKLLDPTGLLNPDVLINADPKAHLQNLKSLPVIEPEVDKCIECGFCEPQCPSRRLTMTPRQRIVLRREIARQMAKQKEPALLTALIEPEILSAGKEPTPGYVYSVLDTCAVDGLCATTCPVNINTGELVKRLRAERISRRGQGIALALVRHFGLVENGVGLGVRLGHGAHAVIGVSGIVGLTQLAERITHLRLPKWNRAVPRFSRHIRVTERGGAEFVYFPSCLSRAMGKPVQPVPGPQHDDPSSLIEVFLTVSRRAGVAVWIPPDSHGHCCGMPFGSKGYTEAYREMLHRTLGRFWEWSEHGRLPVVIDASSCAYTLRSCSSALSPEDIEIWQQLTILDSIEFVQDVLLPRLTVRPLLDEVILHPNCAARKLGLTEKMHAIASRCAALAVVPQNLECCAFAGDRGLLLPELTASATQPEAAEVNARLYDGYYSSNLTCEMGIAAATGQPYRSFLYLVEKATRPS